MRNYIRFVMRSREGLYAYLRILLIVLGLLFAVHMVWLGMLMAEGGIHGESGFMRLYERIGIFAGGIACVVMTRRMLRICVSSGVSRKGFLCGHILMLLLFALVTSAAITLVSVITDGVYHLFGMKFYTLAAQVSWASNQYQPRILAYNLTIVFCLELFLYSVALIITGFRQKFSVRIGLIAVFLAVCFVFISPYSMGRSFWEYILNNPLMQLVFSLCHRINMWTDLECIASEGMTNVVDVQPDHFWFWLLQLAACAVFWYLLCCGIFGLLTARLSVRGKEREG